MLRLRIRVYLKPAFHHPKNELNIKMIEKAQKINLFNFVKEIIMVNCEVCLLSHKVNVIMVNCQVCLLFREVGLYPSGPHPAPLQK